MYLTYFVKNKCFSRIVKYFTDVAQAHPIIERSQRSEQPAPPSTSVHEPVTGREEVVHGTFHHPSSSDSQDTFRNSVSDSGMA